jgi:hypothetical protein
MVNARRLGQLGMLAVGLGVGSAMAATPGIASADNSQVVSSIDPSGLFAAADPAQSLDFQISIDGMDLFPTVGNSAIAFSGTGDMAIAFGAGAQAFAEGGYGDYASANGTDAFAEAGYGGETGNNFDYASASGTDADAQAGNDPHSEFSDATTGNSFDSATASGNDASAYAGFNGSYDSAAASGNVANALAGDNGNGDFASVVGGNTDAEAGESASLVPANDDTAIVLGNLITAQTGLTQAIAGGGFSGPSYSVLGDGGSNDISFTNDPFGTVGSDAVTGLGNNFDLAGVFGDDYVANAFATSNLIDILPSL